MKGQPKSLVAAAPVPSNSTKYFLYSIRLPRSLLLCSLSSHRIDQASGFPLRFPKLLNYLSSFNYRSYQILLLLQNLLVSCSTATCFRFNWRMIATSVTVPWVFVRVSSIASLFLLILIPLIQFRKFCG